MWRSMAGKAEWRFVLPRSRKPMLTRGILLRLRRRCSRNTLPAKTARCSPRPTTGVRQLRRERRVGLTMRRKCHPRKLARLRAIGRARPVRLKIARRQTGQRRNVQLQSRGQRKVVPRQTVRSQRSMRHLSLPAARRLRMPPGKTIRGRTILAKLLLASPRLMQALPNRRQSLKKVPLAKARRRRQNQRLLLARVRLTQALPNPQSRLPRRERKNRLRLRSVKAPLRRKSLKGGSHSTSNGPELNSAPARFCVFLCCNSFLATLAGARVLTESGD